MEQGPYWVANELMGSHIQKIPHTL